MLVSGCSLFLIGVFFGRPIGVGRAGGCLPLLDLVEVGQEGDGDEDNDGLLAVADLNLDSRIMSERCPVESVVCTQKQNSSWNGVLLCEFSYPFACCLLC